MVIKDSHYFREHNLRLEVDVTMNNGSYLSKEHQNVIYAIRSIISGALINPKVSNPNRNVPPSKEEEILRDWLMGLNFKESLTTVPNSAVSNFRQGRNGKNVRVSIDLRGDTYRTNFVERDNVFHIDMRLFFTGGQTNVNDVRANSA